MFRMNCIFKRRNDEPNGILLPEYLSTLWPCTFSEADQAAGTGSEKAVEYFFKGHAETGSHDFGIVLPTRLLIFDETFDGLDPVMRNFVKSLICEDVLERGVSAIMTSHSLRELEDTCDQLALLHKGGLVLESDIQHLKTEQFKVQIAFAEDYDAARFEEINAAFWKRVVFPIWL